MVVQLEEAVVVEVEVVEVWVEVVDELVVESVDAVDEVELVEDAVE